MKERYEKAEIEVIVFETEDVITTSNDPVGDGTGNDNDSNNG